MARAARGEHRRTASPARARPSSVRAATVRERQKRRWLTRAARTRCPRRAVYAGSFDPPTRGHLYVLRTGARLFDELIVAAGDQPEKPCAFPLQERLGFLAACARGLPNVSVGHFEGRFLVDYARSVGAAFILRGIRNAEDLEYERLLRHVNADLAPEITTVFVMPPRELAEVSSSFVKGLAGLEGWPRAVRRFLPAPVYRAFVKHYRGK